MYGIVCQYQGFLPLNAMGNLRHQRQLFANWKCKQDIWLENLILRYFSKNVVLTNLDINVQPQKISFCVFIQRVHRHLTTFIKMKSTPHLWTRFELWWNRSRHISPYFMRQLDLISSFISTTWCKLLYNSMMNYAFS